MYKRQTNNNVNTNPNTNVNNNTSNNTNTLTGGNNTNTNTVGGNTINIHTPPAQVVVLSQPAPGQQQQQQQQQFQQQVQTQTLARTGWSALEPLGAMSGVSLVIGLLMMIVGRSPAAVPAGAYRSDVPVRWGPAEIGRAILGAVVSIPGSARRFRRRSR